MPDSQTLVSEQVKPDQVAVVIQEDGSTTQPPAAQTEPSGETAADTTAAQTDQGPSDDMNPGTADDYLGESQPVQAGETTTPSEPTHDFEKRYRDSSREALKQKARADALEEKIKADPEVAERLGMLPGDGAEQHAEKQETQESKLLLEIKKELNENVIMKFEEGKQITRSVREKMRPFVKALVTHPKAPIPLAKALQAAYDHVVGGNTAAISEEAKAKAFAEMRVNSSAAVRSSGAARPTTGEQTPVTLTPAEYALARKLGVVDEETGKVSASFLSSLQQVRKENQ